MHLVVMRHDHRSPLLLSRRRPLSARVGRPSSVFRTRRGVAVVLAAATLTACGAAGDTTSSIPPPDVLADWVAIHEDADVGEPADIDGPADEHVGGVGAHGDDHDHDGHDDHDGRVDDDVSGAGTPAVGGDGEPPVANRSVVDGSSTDDAPDVAEENAAFDPVDATADERDRAIRSAYQFRYDSYWACLRSPDECDTSYLLVGGPAEAAMQQTLEALSIRGRAVGDDPVGYFVIDRIVHEDLDTVTVTACWWSTAVLYGPPIDPTRPVSPSNPRTVANDVPDGGRQADRFVRVGDAWRLELSTVLDDGFGEDPCTS